jgi:hypothetical protein
MWAHQIKGSVYKEWANGFHCQITQKGKGYISEKLPNIMSGHNIWC